VTNAGNSLLTNQNLLTKVYFPRVAIPASSAFSGLVDFAIASLMLLAIMAYYRFVPGIGILLWPLLMVPLVLLALGMGMFLAAVNVRFRDIRYMLPFFINLWLFITPIIYPASIVPEAFRPLLALNPLTGIIEAFRAAMIPSRPIDWSLLGISTATTCIIFTLASIYFRRTERTFADII